MRCARGPGKGDGGNREEVKGRGGGKRILRHAPEHAYTSQDCQKRHWHMHKVQCKAMKAAHDAELYAPLRVCGDHPAQNHTVRMDMQANAREWKKLAKTL